MSEEKTLGQLLWEKFYEAHANSRGDYHDMQDSTKARWESIAQSLISEFLRRNGEPVAFVDDKGNLVPTMAGILQLKSGDMLFAAPQLRRKPVNHEAEFYPNDAFEE